MTVGPAEQSESGMADPVQPTTTHLATITNNVYDPDAGTVGLLGTDASGKPVIFTVPFELVQVAVSELNRAASAALQARAFIGAPMTMSRRVTVEQPQTFQVGEQGENVLVAFDLGMPSQEVKMLPAQATKVLARQMAAMADKLIRLAARKPRLILPH
jgi:hypothetical protein